LAIHYVETELFQPAFDAADLVHSSLPSDSDMMMCGDNL
jgi:hypothetical protein